MITDQPIYQFLATGPEAFRVLTGGLILQGPYRFSSITIKALERRIDGLFEPVGHNGTVYVLEYEGHAKDTATPWPNLITKVGLCGEQNPHRDVRGILIFAHSSLDKHRPKWMVKETEGPFQVVYLDKFVPEWLERDPDNPYLAVLAPLVITAKKALRKKAPQLWGAIQKAPLKPETRETLAEILAFLFFERFDKLDRAEVWAMFNALTPLKETRAYREILAEGVAEGVIKGEARGMARGKAEGKADDLKRLLTRRFGTLPDWAAQRIEGASIEQLDAWLDGIFDADSVIHLLGSGQH